MEPTGLTGGLYRLSQWIVRLSYLNVLWILFIFAGLIIFGLFPSTAAMFAVTRKWVMGNHDAPVFRFFFDAYKSHFMRSNYLGAILILLGLILYFDLKYFYAMEGILYQFVTILLLSVCSFYVLITFYIFPVMVHYNSKLSHYLKNALLIGLAQPIGTFCAAFACFGLMILSMRFPQFLLFFSGSLISLIIMKAGYRSFIKIKDGNIQNVNASGYGKE